MKDQDRRKADGSSNALQDECRTFISEFPHPRINVHYHPTDDPFKLQQVRDALKAQCDEMELDLQFRPRDQEVVCNHERLQPWDDSYPKLTDVIKIILEKKGSKTTVYGNDLQFFLVLEPKGTSNELLDGVFRILSQNSRELSTGVRPGDRPRGITVVITGVSRRNLSFRYPRMALDRLCIIEGRDYDGDVINLSADQAPFQWVALEHSDERGRVNELHKGTDPGSDAAVGGPFNLRVWNAEDDDDLRMALASGADSVNCDPDKVGSFKQILLSQRPRGRFPSLVSRGPKVFLTWRGKSSNNLYIAAGESGVTGPSFPRQLCLTYFMESKPLAKAPTAALLPDGRFIVVYEGTDEQRLWYVTAKFTRADRFLTLVGTEHRLTLPNDRGRRGTDPSVAVTTEGRVLVVYEGTDDQKLWYVSGFLDETGELVGTEYSLTQGESRRGSTPSIAFDSSDKVIITYQGTDEQRLWYVSGALDSNGRILGEEYSLTEGEARRGSTPSVAIDGSGRVLIVYQGTANQKLWYVSGSRDGSGQLIGDEFSLTQGDARRGSDPTAAFDELGGVTVLYQGTDEEKLWYVHGRIAENGRVIGQERLLDMSLERW